MPVYYDKVLEYSTGKQPSSKLYFKVVLRVDYSYSSQYD